MHLFIVSIGELKLDYLQKVYIVTMQTFQMSIMLLFEDRDTINYTEIREMLQITNDQFQKNINSLIECKLLLIDDDVSKLFTNFNELPFLHCYLLIIFRMYH